MYAIRSYYEVKSLQFTLLHLRVEIYGHCSAARFDLHRLYQSGLAGFVIGSGLAPDESGVGVTAGCRRITSYNVCYTKLLRHPHVERIDAAWFPSKVTRS